MEFLINNKETDDPSIKKMLRQSKKKKILKNSVGKELRKSTIASNSKTDASSFIAPKTKQEYT